MNGKTVEVDNTDAEGRLVLSGLYLYTLLPFQKSNPMHRYYLLYIYRIQTPLID